MTPEPETAGPSAVNGLMPSLTVRNVATVICSISLREHALEEHVRRGEVAHPADQFHQCILVRVDALAADLNEIALRVRAQIDVIRVEEVHRGGRRTAAETAV